MTKLSGETFSMMRTPRPELPILFSVHKLCLCTRIMYSSWNLFLVSSTMQECTKMYDFAQKISFFSQGNTPGPPMWEGWGSVHPCLGAEPFTGYLLATGLLPRVIHFLLFLLFSAFYHIMMNKNVYIFLKFFSKATCPSQMPLSWTV